MRRIIFAFIGVLVCVLSVSCEDKLLDNGKNNTQENSDGESYKSVLDSSFKYVDGRLATEIRRYYTQNSLLERDVRKEYDSDGNLSANEENVYTYSDSEGDNYVCISSSNGVELKKKEAYYTGTKANHVTQNKEYVKHGGEWFLRSDLYAKTENNRGHGCNFIYMIYNGQRVAVERIVLIDGIVDPVEDVLLYSDRTYYNASYRLDPSDPDGLTISTLGKGSWRKRIQRNNSQGVMLFKEEFLSVDSITWISTGGNETECDINGNVVCERYFSGDGKIRGKRYNTYSDDNRFISSCYCEFSENGDSVSTTDKVFYYSDAGVLDSAELLFGFNMAGRFPIDFNRLSNDIYMGTGKNNVLGAKYVALFDSDGNLVKETLYHMDDNDEMENTPCAYCTMSYDSDGRCTGYEVYVSGNGEWVRIETGSSVYDSKGNELSSHIIYTGLPESAAELDPRPSKTTYQESNRRAEYDSYGNVSYRMNEERYARLSNNDGSPVESNGSEKTEEFYSTVKVK